MKTTYCFAEQSRKHEPATETPANITSWKVIEASALLMMYRGMTLPMRQTPFHLCWIYRMIVDDCAEI